ncbi:MAG: prevent-host-death protein [Acidobacteriota bacterium]
MQTVEVTILEPKAEAMLDEMEDKKLIKLSKPDKNGGDKKPLQFGSMKGLVLYIADDFDAPIEDFEKYM